MTTGPNSLAAEQLAKAMDRIAKLELKIEELQKILVLKVIEGVPTMTALGDTSGKRPRNQP
jgi:hypothetical protein